MTSWLTYLPPAIFTRLKIIQFRGVRMNSSDLQNEFLADRFAVYGTTSNFHFAILKLVLTTFKSKSSIECWILNLGWKIALFYDRKTISQWIYGACFLDEMVMICTRSAIDHWIANMIDVISMKVIFFSMAQLWPSMEKKRSPRKFEGSNLDSSNWAQDLRI